MNDQNLEVGRHENETRQNAITIKWQLTIKT